jgi:hypothetical protein
MSDPSWRLYSVYFDLKCPFDHDAFNNALESDNDVIYDGMDFMVKDNKKVTVYGYWFFVRDTVVESFVDYIHEAYGEDIHVHVDESNYIVRRSSGRTNFKYGKYKF